MGGAEAIFYIEAWAERTVAFMFSAFARYALKNMVHASDRVNEVYPVPFFLEIPWFTISEFVYFVTRSECEKLFILWAEPMQFFIMKFGADRSVAFVFAFCEVCF